jgi:TRAP-type uncharacterized transport system fused permease subunit
MDSKPLGNTRSTQTAPPDEAGLLKNAQSLWQDLRELGYDHFLLVTLEAQRAGKSLAIMVAAGVLMAGLLCGAWIGGMAAAVLELTGHGVRISHALLIVAGGNLLLALMLYGLIRHMSRYLGFPATLGSLQPQSPALRAVKKR